MHWVQSLRSRGFRENELILEVNAWQEENGPFRSVEKRYPPTSKDIMNVFGDGNEPLVPVSERKYLERERARERPWDERREESIRKENSYRLSKEAKEAKEARWLLRDVSRNPYQETPPKSYTCNRCGEKGMPRSLGGSSHLLHAKLTCSFLWISSKFLSGRDNYLPYVC